MFCQKWHMARHLYLALCLITTNSFAETGRANAYVDASGIKQDFIYLMGYQALSIGFMYYMPDSVTGWSDNERDELGFRQWKRHIQNPHWDEDHWFINYVLHPYWGGAYYIRGRERGYNKTESFWISVIFSTVYEFAIESFMEEPSVQDLFVTPLAGTAVGIYFEQIRTRIKNKDEPISRSDKMILALTDPLGAMNRTVNSWLGIKDAQQPMAQVGLSLLRSDNGMADQDCPRLQGKCGGQTIDGAALTFKFIW